MRGREECRVPKRSDCTAEMLRARRGLKGANYQQSEQSRVLCRATALGCGNCAWSCHGSWVDGSRDAPPGSSDHAAVHGDERQELVEQGASQQRGDLAVVVLGLNLDQVKADQVEAPEATHQSERIAAARSPDFGRAG